jgi:uncharacterized spore protein YtfJ
MSVPEILKTIADGFQSGATVKNVYGEPISKGDTTVIPVARLSYAFGGGGGREAEGAAEKDGAGGVVAVTCQPSRRALSRSHRQAHVLSRSVAGARLLRWLE